MHQTGECLTHCRHIYFHTFVLFVIPLVRHSSPFTVSFISIAFHFTIIYNHCSLYFFLYFDSPYVGSAISSVGYTRPCTNGDRHRPWSERQLCPCLVGGGARFQFANPKAFHLVTFPSRTKEKLIIKLTLEWRCQSGFSIFVPYIK
jgi:hypothetical protein